MLDALGASDMLPDLMSRLALFASILLALAGCADKTPPTWSGDAELVASDVAAETLTLRWPSATDDDALASYRVLQDDVEIATVASGTTEHAPSGLRDSTEYRFSVQPIDAAGNRGEMLHVRATTSDGTPPSWPAGARLIATTTQPSGGEAGVGEAGEAGTGGEAVNSATSPRHTLTWAPAEDASGVVGYLLVVGDELVAEVPNVLTYDLLGELPAGLSIVAVDAAENRSARLVARSADAEGTVAEGAVEGSVAEGAAEGAQNAAPRATAIEVSPQVRDALSRIRIRPNLLKLRPEELRVREGLDLRHGNVNTPPAAQ